MLTIAALVPMVGLAVTPGDGGPLGLSPVVINASPGDQSDPHVSGDIAAYTDGIKIRYYRFLSTADSQVPSPVDASDVLSDVSNGKIVFSRVETSGRMPIMVYDTNSNTTVEVDPTPLPFRFGSAIGSDTVAFIDFSAESHGELYASAIGGTAVRLTNDTLIDQHPSVSPLGDRIVFESCAAGEFNCDVHLASLSGGAWTVTTVAATPEPEANPDTDGVTVVYDATRSGERDVYWQPIGGGAEQRLALPGEQRNPAISAGVIGFESVAVGKSAADLFVYELATNRLFQVTNTDGVDETLNDIVVLPDGSVRVVWASAAGGALDHDIYGATFSLPPVVTPTCTPRQAALTATRNYRPSTWSDGTANLAGFTFAVPAEIAVTEGDSANEMVRLVFSRAGGDPVKCFYRGGTVAHPQTTAEVAAGQKYTFDHCTEPSVTAGSVVVADSLVLHVQGGDNWQPRTVVGVTVDEICPEVAAASGGSGSAETLGCSSTSGTFTFGALALALLAWLTPRRTPIRVRARGPRR